MTLRQRLSTAYKALTTDMPLGNSLGAEVIRNYGGKTKFEPHRQVTGITYKAIDKIGQSVSVYQPILSRGGGEAIENHPVLALYKNPSPRRNATDFIYLYTMLHEIYGETFWYKATGENTGKVKELYLLNPAQIQLYFDKGELAGYVLHKNNGRQLPLGLDEVIHDMRPNPFNEWRGQSVLEKSAVYIDTEIASSNFTLNYITNSASPSGIVSLPEMEKATFEQFTRKWREGYEGPENAGKTAFIRGGEAQFKAVGSTLKDIDQEVTRKMAEDDVLMMLEVPKPLLGRSGEKGLGRSDIDALYYIFAREKVEPMMRRLDRIYETLAMDFDKGRPINVSHNTPIPKDKEFEHKQNKDLVNVALTVNEVRESLGKESLGSEYDKIIPSNAIPDKASTQAKAVTTKRVVLKSGEQRADDDEAELVRRNVELIRVADTWALKIKAVMSKFSAGQEKRVLAKLDAYKKSDKRKAYEEFLFEIKEEAEKMGLKLTPVLIAQMEAQAEDVRNWISGEPMVIDDSMKAVTEARILRLSADYQLNNYTKLEKLITEDVGAGKSVGAIKKDIEGAYKTIKGYDAERIARTEAIKTANRTAMEVYKQSGFSKVRWRVNFDACEFCQQFSGKTIEIGSRFAQLGEKIVGTKGNVMTIAYEDVDAPALHPNCTCSLDPVK